MTLQAAIERIRAADSELNRSRPTPFPLPVDGLEAVIAGSITALHRGDWWVPGLRERVGAVLRDVPIERLIDGHTGAKPYRIAPPTASPALRAVQAVGIALAARDCAVLVHLGIGSTADGAFHEALNLAALLGANVIFVVAVHPLDNAPVGAQLNASPAALAEAHGIRAQRVNGSSAAAVHAAVTSAREALGPQLIEARLAPRQIVVQ